MAMIGEELMALLGMIPVRDQAGIPRGNLAQETAANAARMQTASLEPQPDQMPIRGLPSAPAPQPPIATPPDVQLPGDTPVSYASAKSPVTTAIPPNARTVQNALPNSPLPEPDEARTIATAPSNALTQLDQQIARREQMGQMNSVLSGLQLLTNSFNRDPESRSTNQNSILAGMGGGGLDVKDITEIYKTRELLQKADDDRRAAVQASQLRERLIQNMMAKRGWSREQAEGAIATGTAKDVYDQDKNKAYYEDQLKEKTRQKILGDPELQQEMAAKAGLSVPAYRAQLERGELLDSKTLADIANTNATAAHSASTTAGQQQEQAIKERGIREHDELVADLLPRAQEIGDRNDIDAATMRSMIKTDPKAVLEMASPKARAEIAAKLATTAKTAVEAKSGAVKLGQDVNTQISYDEARANPLEFMEKYGINTPTEYRKITATQPTYEKWLADQATTDPWTKTYETAKRGDPTMTPEKWKTLGVAKTVDNPGDAAFKSLLIKRGDSVNKAKDAADEKLRDLTVESRVTQDLWEPDKILAGSKYSAPMMELRKSLATLMLPEGKFDPKVAQTEAFMNTLGERVLTKANDFPGALSNDDREFLRNLSGTQATSKEGIRRLLHIRDLINRAEIERYNNNIRLGKNHADKDVQRMFAAADEIAQPAPNKVARTAFEKRGKASLQKAIQEGHVDDPEYVQDFERSYGIGTLQHFRRELEQR